MNKILHGDSLEVLKGVESESVDLVCTDPPYGYSFMGKSWDKTLPDIGIFKECLRVLKPGAFAFVMSAPRSDVCARMMLMLEDAGFEIGFTPIYWTYASGFPKAMNIGKMVDKRRWGGEMMNIRKYLKLVIDESGVSHKRIKEHLGVDHKSGVVSNWTITDSGASVPSGSDWIKLKEILPIDSRYDDLILEIAREELGREKMTFGIGNESARLGDEKVINKATSNQAKALDGSYGGFQPKPAVEVVIVAMKPLSEKTFVDQALKNGKGITWLDNARIPFEQGGGYKITSKPGFKPSEGWNDHNMGVQNFENFKGRFPANLLVEDDILNDGRIQKSGRAIKHRSSGENFGGGKKPIGEDMGYGDSGSYSRFFSLDAWSQNLPFLQVPKASKSEKFTNLTCNCETAKIESWVKEDLSQKEKTVATSQHKGISEETLEEDSGSNTLSYGKSTMEKSLKVSKSITSIESEQTTESKISNSLVPQTTKESIQDVKLEMENGGNHANFAIVSKESTKTTGTSQKKAGQRTGVVVPAISVESLKTSVCVECGENPRSEAHPTQKPLKLMSYLITLGSREGDTILDPFVGSGTTCVAAKELGRKFVGVEREKEYVDIAESRIEAVPTSLFNA
jgi:DNA modification methylase